MMSSSVMCGPGPNSARVTAAWSPALVTNGSIEQLRGHLGRDRQNGLSQTELKEMIIHLAFYAGWPRAMSAIALARELFTGGGGQ
jgi:alkylhydroperoxidase/carboxymuconolactone decarboxylase family protein YurZ